MNNFDDARALSSARLLVLLSRRSTRTGFDNSGASKFASEPTSQLSSVMRKQLPHPEAQPHSKTRHVEQKSTTAICYGFPSVAVMTYHHVRESLCFMHHPFFTFVRLHTSEACFTVSYAEAP